MTSTNSEQQLPEEETVSVDTELAALLARLSGLQGYAIPVHRFSMMSTTTAGGQLADMSRTLRAKEWWLSALPGSDVQSINALPDREDFPAFWISEDGREVLILRSQHSNGDFAVELPDGSTREKSADSIRQGQTLLMRPVSPDAVGESKLLTAKDWFVHAIKKRKAVFIEAVIATSLISILTLIASLYSMQVYDRVVPSQGYSTLIVLTVGAGIALILELLMKSLRSSMVDKICKKIDEELSSVFFARVLAIRMDARPKTIGTFASQVKQFEMVRNFLTSSTLFVLADLPFVFLFIGVIAMIGGWLAVIPLILVPISLTVGFMAQWRIAKASEDQVKAANHKNGVLIEAIDGIEAIKSVGGEWKLQNSWRNLTSEASEYELSIRTTTSTATHLAQTLQQASYISMIGLGAYFITLGEITQGALIACSIISNRALGPISQIAGMIVQWQHAKVALKGLDDMMALPCDQTPGEQRMIPTTCKGQLTLDGASFGYSDANRALKAMKLNIKPGERIAVLGVVGSGKSTLIKLLSGLYRPTEGRVFLDGVDVAHLAPDFVREHVGYLTQDVRLFNGTLRENLIIGLPSPTDGQILEAARKTGLDRITKEHPAGFGLPIMEGGRGLSGGQRQVVGLTRLLLAKPKILLLDEPTASMDSELEAHVMRNIFASMDKDSVIVMATHKRSLVNLVDRVIVIDKGTIMLDGPRDEIMNKLRGPAPRPAPTTPVVPAIATAPV